MIGPFLRLTNHSQPAQRSLVRSRAFLDRHTLAEDIVFAGERESWKRHGFYPSIVLRAQLKPDIAAASTIDSLSWVVVREPTAHDLEDVLEALTKGEPVVPRTTKAEGFYIADLKK